jgi:hypothetical protein
LTNSCFIINQPKVAAVYVFPTGQHPAHSMAAHKFATKVQLCPAGLDHELIIVFNGPAPVESEKDLFNGLPCLRSVQSDDRAYDISAYQDAAQQTDSDLMIFIGGNTYPTRPDWAKKCFEIWQQYGDGIYGAMGNQGDDRVNVTPHIRTTGFWMPRKLFNAYPVKVERPDQRYPFEHGKESLTQWVRKQGLPAMVAGWHDVRDVLVADTLPNGFHAGNQSNLIFKDRLCEPPYFG